VASSVTTTGKARWNAADLSDTAQAVFEGGRWVTGVVVNGCAAAEIVILRATADTPEYMRISVAIAGFVAVPFRWFAEGGLEAITASAAGDVNITVVYE